MTLYVAAFLVLMVWAVWRTTVQLRDAEGWERRMLRNSFWLLGGTGLLMLTIVAGPALPSFGLRIGLIGAAAVLTGVGVVRTARLRSARTARLIEEGRRARTLVERVEALEARKALIPQVKLGYRLIGIGGGAFLAAMGTWAALSSPTPGFGALFATLAAMGVGLVVLDVALNRSRTERRAEIDRRLEAALAALDDPDDSPPGTLSAESNELLR